MHYSIYMLAYRRFVTKHYKWRNGPVPFVHKSRNYHYFRHPSTSAERTANVGFEKLEAKEFNVKIRRARANKNLPSAYDDLSVGAREDRNWKHFRRTQYKGN